MVSFPPPEPATYSDEKIVMLEPVRYDIQVAGPNRRPSQAPEVVLATLPSPPPVPPLPIPFVSTLVPSGCAKMELPPRPRELPFWKRHILWIAAAVGFGVLLIGVVVGVIGHTEIKSTKASNATNTTTSAFLAVANNTRNSVASSGSFQSDKKTWNTHVLWQASTGGINLQVSLDSSTFQPEQQINLRIPPRIGSPISATTEIDPRNGVAMLNVFYLSGVNNITMSVITCVPNTDKCNTVANRYLPTQVAPSNFTGLAAINVDEAQDWRVYYHDKDGNICELVGNNSGFDLGTPIGGQGLNASSITAVNINSTTNNVRVFYVDGLTQALFKTQFTAGDWTKPSIVSAALIDNWNPKSGLSAAYTKDQDQLHVYYTGLDGGIYEFLGFNASKATNAKWAAQPRRNHLWHTADHIGAPITAIGWNDQARFYQVKEGDLAEGHLDGQIWTEAFIDKDGTIN
ncbi:uncharacterized protein RSE6_13203 [Rhynchosporium secalis]|uniref:Fucose-specific lectin n=1 Tax=Rhynchosporium secalis TaxID=38038 RepID=A0A1E1MSC7_RHYSE|nr:uncharacterized protein RSE6_13203 [Rhynchosporium secalis]